MSERRGATYRPTREQKCWYVTETAIEETSGCPAIGGSYWVCQDEEGDFYCKMGENLFLAYEDAREELLRRLCSQRDQIMRLIAALGADPVHSV